MIGVFITTEYLDLYDMESYLNDHASSLVNDGSITLGNDSKYEGKLFAELLFHGFGQFCDEFV